MSVLTVPPKYGRGSPRMGGFRQWLLDGGVKPVTAETIVVCARMGFNRLAWEPELSKTNPRLAERRIGNYMRVLKPSEHALFRHAWGRFRRYLQEVRHMDAPEAPGGHGSAFYSVHGKALATAVAQLMARWPLLIRLRREELAALTWAQVLAPAGEAILVRLGTTEVAFAPRHAEVTFDPLLQWAQPWAQFCPAEDIIPSRPLIPATPGGAKPMAPSGVRRLLSEHGLPLNQRQANSWLLAQELEAGRAADQSATAVMRRHEEMQAHLDALAEPGVLEKRWAELYPDAPLTDDLTAEQAGLLGGDALIAFDRRQDRAFARVAAAQVTDRIERADQIAVELGNNEALQELERRAIDRLRAQDDGQKSSPPPDEPLLVWPSRDRGS